MGGTVVSGRRQDPAAAARLAGELVVLHTLDAPVAEVWRAPVGFRDIFSLRGDLDVVGQYVDGSPTLTTIGTATGTPRWSATVSDTVEEDLAACEAFGDPATAVSTHVACRVVTSESLPGGGCGEPVADLVVWDGRTGAVAAWTTWARSSSRAASGPPTGDRSTRSRVRCGSRCRTTGRRTTSC